jgi:hypothetical protein
MRFGGRGIGKILHVLARQGGIIGPESPGRKPECPHERLRDVDLCPGERCATQVGALRLQKIIGRLGKAYARIRSGASRGAGIRVRAVWPLYISAGVLANSFRK